MILEGGGTLQNAESCYLTLPGMQLYPAMRGESEFSTQNPVLYTPTIPAVATTREKEVLQQLSLLNGTNLEQLSTSISSHHIEADINTLLHLHASAHQNASKSNWTVWGLIVAGVVLTLFIFYYFTHSYIWSLCKICAGKCVNMEGNSAQQPQIENPSPSHPNPTSAENEDLTGPTPQMRYSVYSLQSA